MDLEGSRRLQGDTTRIDRQQPKSSEASRRLEFLFSGKVMASKSKIALKQQLKSSGLHLEVRLVFSSKVMTSRKIDL